MIDAQTLKQFIMLGYLTDDMLNRLIPITKEHFFEENEVIFKQDEKADRLYFVKTGKVLLEYRIADKITVTMSAVRPGFSFGWSAMLDDEPYSTDAICNERCEILSIKASDLKQEMINDHSMGYIISQRLLYVVKKRYDARTEQFVKTIKFHPDISKLL